MNKIICKDCFKEFNTNQHLDVHQNKKNKCNKKTNFKCNKCNKYYKSKYYLKQHENKCLEIINDSQNVTPNILEKNDIKNAISFIINSNETIDNKIILLNKYKTNMTNDEIKILLNSTTILNDGKISIFYTTINSTDNNISNNINSNNTNSNNVQTTNNIQINQFGNENIDYLDNKYFAKLLVKHKINVENALIDLTKDIHLRMDHPENRNIKVTNINNKYASVYDNGKWRNLTKNELKEKMFKKNTKLIKIHYDSLKDVLNEKNKKYINIFLARDFEEDQVLKDINEKVILLFYSKDI
jgi:hypothetical protein